MIQNRAERRKAMKCFRGKLSQEQFEKLQSEANMEYLEREVQKRMDYNFELFKEAIDEAFKRNNISSSKANAVMDDMVMIMKRKAEERKKNG